MFASKPWPDIKKRGPFLIFKAVSEALPSLRSYAHLLIEDTVAGDEIVGHVLKDLVYNDETSECQEVSREDLFQSVDARLLNHLQAMSDGGAALETLRGLTLYERRCLLLTAIGRFEPCQVARITGISLGTVEYVLNRVRPIVSAARCTGVLIIEDEPHMAELLGVLVEQSGHHVAGIAHTLDEAVELARSKQFELILSDIQLHHSESGKDAVQKICSLVGWRIPTVYITAHPERVSPEEAAQADGLISKPFDIWRVREAIDGALGRATAHQQAG